MQLISIFLLAITANIDNFAVAIAYGLKRLKIGINTNLFIALVSATGTFLSISVGLVLRDSFSVAFANGLGSSTLIMLGIWGIWDTFRREKKRRQRTARFNQERMPVAAGFSDSKPFSERLEQDEEHQFAKEFFQEFSYESFLENPEKADTDESGHIDTREAIALAFGLSLNNLGIGVGAGISGFDAGLATGLTFGLSLLAMNLGYLFGHQFNAKTSGFWAGILGSSLVVITGIYESFVY